MYSESDRQASAAELPLPKGGDPGMRRQTIGFAVQKIRDMVVRIGRSYITHPEIKFSGGSIRWYEDKARQQHGSTKG